jgi:hypothetical protein
MPKHTPAFAGNQDLTHQVLGERLTDPLAPLFPLRRTPNGSLRPL